MAVLRSILGVKDGEMAELLRCSRGTIHSVESGRLKLSDSLALRAGVETGVSVSWLLNGRPTAKPTEQDYDKPFTRESFDRWRANKTDRLSVSKTQRALDALSFAAAIGWILEDAHRRDDYVIARCKVGQALGSLTKQFITMDAGTDGHLHLDRQLEVVAGVVQRARDFIDTCNLNRERIDRERRLSGKNKQTTPRPSKQSSGRVRKVKA